MKKTSKVWLSALCVVMLTVGAVFGTLAYFTDNDSATNTFSVGKVYISLDESDESTSDTADRTTEGNEYHLLPGHEYVKDPTVTVKEGSSEAYVRMMVTINYSSQMDAIFAPGADLMNIFDGYDPATWPLYGITKDDQANIRTYEFRYKEIVPATNSDMPLDDLFESFTIPGTITKEQLATLVTKDNNGNIIDQFNITVVAHAIQAAGFDTADLAWAAFAEQNK